MKCYINFYLFLERCLAWETCCNSE